MHWRKLGMNAPNYVCLLDPNVILHSEPKVPTEA